MGEEQGQNAASTNAVAQPLRVAPGVRDDAVQAGFEQRAFQLRAAWHKEGVDGNVSKCMELSPFPPEMHASIKEVLRTQVVPSWVKRAGGQEAARLFNDIVGPLVGFTATP